MDNMRAYCDLIKDAFSCSVDPSEISDFFQGIGLVNPGGSFYKERTKKFFEITNFSLHVIKAINRVSRKKRTTLLDCGCGRSYLSFFINFLLSKTDTRDTYFMGVDQNPKLIEGCLRAKEKLEYKNMDFHSTRIIDFQPPEKAGKIHATFSLHACDTATDEAIAKGIQLESRHILVAPCCQREIVRQLGRLSSSKVAHPLKSMAKNYFFREKLGITLTETLRTLVLEAAGYKVDVFTFVSSKYTPKNTMLRAQKMRQQNLEALRSYHELKSFFHLIPKIEDYLPKVLGK